MSYDVSVIILVCNSLNGKLALVVGFESVLN
jgi:hypothetical protein